MDLVLGLTTAIASMIAFSIGFIFGKMKQADKDKADVFNAIYNVSKKRFLGHLQPKGIPRMG